MSNKSSDNSETHEEILEFRIAKNRFQIILFTLIPSLLFLFFTRNVTTKNIFVMVFVVFLCSIIFLRQVFPLLGASYGKISHGMSWTIRYIGLFILLIASSLLVNISGMTPIEFYSGIAIELLGAILLIGIWDFVSNDLGRDIKSGLQLIEQEKQSKQIEELIEGQKQLLMYIKKLENDKNK